MSDDLVRCTFCGSENTDPAFESRHLRFVPGYHAHNGRVSRDPAYLEPYHYCSDCGILFRREETCRNFAGDGLHNQTIDGTKALEAFRQHEKQLASPMYIDKWNWVLKHVGSGDLLDVGCEYGFFIAHAKKTGLAVRGIDPFLAAARLGKDHLGVDIDVGYYNQDSYPAGEFDVIASESCSYYFRPSIRTFIEMAMFHLRPGGFIYITVPGIDRTGPNFISNLGRVLLPFENVESIFSRLGLKVVAKSNAFGRLGDIAIILRKTEDGLPPPPKPLPLSTIRREMIANDFQLYTYVARPAPDWVKSLLSMLAASGMNASASLVARAVSRIATLVVGRRPGC